MLISIVCCQRSLTTAVSSRSTQESTWWRWNTNAVTCGLLLWLVLFDLLVHLLLHLLLVHILIVVWLAPSHLVYLVEQVLLVYKLWLTARIWSWRRKFLVLVSWWWRLRNIHVFVLGCSLILRQGICLWSVLECLEWRSLVVDLDALSVLFVRWRRDRVSLSLILNDWLNNSCLLFLAHEIILNILPELVSWMIQVLMDFNHCTHLMSNYRDPLRASFGQFNNLIFQMLSWNKHASMGPTHHLF
jgi:hypothetical protein